MKFGHALGREATSISKVEDLIFTRRRLSLCGYTFLAANIAAFAVHFVAGNWLIDRAGNYLSTDFLQWWLGSRVALGRGAAAVYNDSTFSAARTLVTKSAPPDFLFSLCLSSDDVVALCSASTASVRDGFLRLAGCNGWFVCARPIRHLALRLVDCADICAIAGCKKCL